MDDRGADAFALVPISDESDVVMVRVNTRRIGAQVGLATRAIDSLATAVSEIAHNILAHAGKGEIVIRRRADAGRVGVEVVARDRGPGIAALEQALTDGYSSSGGLGLGLASARRLVDEFEIESVVGIGTTVTLRCWIPPTTDRP